MAQLYEIGLQYDFFNFYKTIGAANSGMWGSSLIHIQRITCFSDYVLKSINVYVMHCEEARRIATEEATAKPEKLATLSPVRATIASTSEWSS